MKQKLLFVFSFISFFCSSQNIKKTFYGKIIDSLGSVKNANIINTKTQKGTFADENGLFTIVAKKNDTLHITSIGYTSKIIAVKSKHLNNTSKNKITLSKKVNVLAEIVIKQNKLVGTLQIDIKKTPTHYKDKIVNKIVEDLKKMDTYKISKMGTNLNETHLTKSTKIRLPNNRFEGFGITTSTSSGSEKLKMFEKELLSKKVFPDKLLHLLGPVFFYEELKIPKEKYYQFITYCTFSGIFEQYQNDKIMLLIKTLKKEANIFLPLKN